MPKNSPQEQFLKIKDFIDTTTLMAKRLLREVPKTLEILETALENDSSDTGAAMVRLLKAIKEADNDNY